MSRVPVNRAGRAARLVAALGLALGLAACGGGDDDDAVASSGGSGIGADNTVPAGAAGSVSSFVEFLKALAGGNETSEPATMGESFTAPADETAEPTVLTS